ncbi:MAG: hypothetical protein JWM83_1140 [Candidatus Angelobacter sp.]|nr:hypothetical protein [Candidatus Angelobacter sp.]
MTERFGERGRNRTFNLLIKSQLLCQLSYAPFVRESSMRDVTGSSISVTQGFYRKPKLADSQKLNNLFIGH